MIYTLGVTEDEQTNQYTCMYKEWKKKITAIYWGCHTFMKTGNIRLNMYWFQLLSVLHSRTRIVGDGNCFFELFCIHLLAHRNIIMKFAYWLQPTWLTTQQILYLSCFLNVGETMDSYIEQSKTQSLGTWATEIEIIAAASLLQTTIYVYGPCGKMNKWHT